MRSGRGEKNPALTGALPGAPEPVPIPQRGNRHRPLGGDGGVSTVPRNKGGQADRLISTGKLNALLHLHLRPINLVVFEEPRGISYLGGGFTLICLQRLSFPNVATLLCP